MLAVAAFVALAVPAQADPTNEAFDSPSSAAKEPPLVKIPIRTVQTPGRNGQNGIIMIRVGESAPFPVIVDTGFSGLLVFPGAWDRRPAGITMSNHKITTRTPEGKQIPGFRASATMTFGGVSTVFPVSFNATNSDSPYLKAWTRMGVYGLLGLGTKGAGGVNPITALPGELGLRWSLHFARDFGGQHGRLGELMLGALPPADPDMAFDLPYNGRNINGALQWDDQAANGCWKIGPMRETCVPTQFDAAFTLMRVKGREYSHLPQDRSGYLKPGTAVALAAPGSAFHGMSFRAGKQASRNLVKVMANGKPKIITSNSIYFDYTVTYNTATGRVYFTGTRPTLGATS